MCHTFCIDSSGVLVPRHRREVCPLARRVMLPGHLAQPVSSPLQGGIRFFPTPIPAPPLVGLTAFLPFLRKEQYGLTTFHTSTMDEVGSACSPVARHLRETIRERLHLATSLVGQACQPLWLVGSHDVYRQFTCVSHVIPPLLPTAVGLAVVHALSRGAHHLVGEATLSQELHTAKLPWPHVLVGY